MIFHHLTIINLSPKAKKRREISKPWKETKGEKQRLRYRHSRSASNRIFNHEEKKKEKKGRRKNEKTKCFIFRALYIRARITQMTQKFERSRIQVERKQIGGWKVQFQRSIDKRIPSS